MFVQCGVLFAFLALGELIVWSTGVPLPSSVIGMVALAASLKAGIVRLRQVERVADFLVHNIGFFFVPAGIGIMNCLGILREQWWPIIASCVLSTIVIIVVTGRVHQWARHNRLLNLKRRRAAKSA